MTNEQNADAPIDWVAEHSQGLYEEEIANLMLAIEPILDGHSRAIVIITLVRTISAMLGPAKDSTRAALLREIVPTIERVLVKMDEAVADGRLPPRES